MLAVLKGGIHMELVEFMNSYLKPFKQNQPQSSPKTEISPSPAWERRLARGLSLPYWCPWWAGLMDNILIRTFWTWMTCRLPKHLLCILTNELMILLIAWILFWLKLTPGNVLFDLCQIYPWTRRICYYWNGWCLIQNVFRDGQGWLRLNLPGKSEIKFVFVFQSILISFISKRAVTTWGLL